VQVKTKNLLVGILVMVLVVALWYKVLYSPAKSSATKANDQAEQVQQQVDVMRTQVASETAKRKEAAAAVPAKKLQAAVPVNDQLTTFIRKSDALANSSGVAWQSVTPTAPTTDGSMQTINVAVNVAGGYASVMAYLRGMLGAERILIIDNVAFTAAAPVGDAGKGGGLSGEVFGSVGGTPSLQVTIAGRLFAQADAAASAAAAPKSGSASSNR
ncbi:MAG TPA: type 4a pilus biogenesis protein PilO, partial [Acidimicrobiia bacterium]|nr:type 4a pilus biogenesis protein PilO [Acidimicrobiia bacterium]